MKHLLLTTIAAVVLVGCGTSIYEAAEEGQIEEVKKLLPAGADVNANAKWERTPLHAAAKTGQKDIIELLIVAGANVNAKDFENKTPLDEAIQLKRTETADLLRKHGGKTGEELKAEGK